MLFNGPTYWILPFERDYSRDAEEWENLWTAILETISPPAKQHTTWDMVLQTLDNRTFQNITFDAKGFRVV
jgi:hypothetical protein